MATAAEKLQGLIDEYIDESRHVMEHAREAKRHLADGDLDAVRKVISLSVGKAGSAAHAREAILKELG